MCVEIKVQVHAENGAAMSKSIGPRLMKSKKRGENKTRGGGEINE